MRRKVRDGQDTSAVRSILTSPVMNGFVPLLTMSNVKANI